MNNHKKTLPIDPALPPAEKLRQYVSQTPDPYQYKINDTTIETRWISTENTLQDCLNHLFDHLSC